MIDRGLIGAQRLADIAHGYAEHVNKLKGHRAVATRYDCEDYMFRGTVDVASIRIWLRDPVP